MNNVESIRTCKRCGAEFIGFNSAKFCRTCKAELELEGCAPAGAPDGDERDGWRHMCRDATGTVIAPGGNVMHALDALCEYEEACEALGVEGPQQLRNLLSHVATLMPQKEIYRCAQKGRRPEPRKRKASTAVKIEYGCRVCGSCGNYRPDRKNHKGSAGTCAVNKRMIHQNGGRTGPLVEVPGEQRRVTSAREACGDWTRKADNAAVSDRSKEAPEKADPAVHTERKECDSDAG